MKIKIFLLVCLFIGIGLTKLSAQNSRDVYDWPVPAFVVQLDVYCDGQLVDQVINTTDYILKCRDKYKNGEWTAWNQHLNNVAFESTRTKETFKMQGHEKGAFNEGMGYGEFRFNLIGNKGSHYIVSIEYKLDPNTWELTELNSKAVCH